MLIIQSDLQRVALAALLHDIGKLLHRSNEYSKKTKLGNSKHPSLSSWFVEYLVEKNLIVEDKILQELVQKHHESHNFPEELKVESIDNPKIRKLAKLVSRADNYSSKERDESTKEENSNFRTRPLDSVFSQVNIEKGDENHTVRYSLRTFSEENIMPKEDLEKNSQEEITNLIDSFLEELSSIQSDSFHVFYINLIDLLKKYTWCLPSDTQSGICDISLYDHLKNSSAIAVALYSYFIDRYGSFEKIEEKEIEKADRQNYFLLIGGDVSGIQKYIYALENTDKIAKRLRARSFFIKMLSQLASYKFIQELDLKISNIVMSSGGKFYILAPNSTKIKENIETLTEKINDELYHQYQTQIFLNISFVELSGEELGTKISEKYDILNDKLSKNKHLKFKKQILEQPIFEDALYGSHKEIGMCKICQKRITLENKDCDYCEKDVKIGGLLPTLEKIYIYTKEQKTNNQYISLFGLYAYLDTQKEKFVEKETPFLTLYYKHEKWKHRKIPYLQDFYGGYTPLNEEGEVKTFEEIAKESKSNNLGVLKGDVDDLGLIFSLGLKEMFSISRMSFLSNMLDAFFSFYLPNYLKKKENSYYIVYSGGDDFMIVGAWDKLLEIAQEIESKFGEFVGGNPNFTLTQGIAITKPKDPIYFSSKWATEAEEYGKTSGKDGIVIFNTYIPWRDYYKVNSLIQFIDKNMKKEEESSCYTQSFLYRLLHYTEMMEKYRTEKDAKYLKYISDFYYDTKRNLLSKLTEEIKREKNYKEEKDARAEAINDRRYTELEKYFGLDSIQGEKQNQEFAVKYMRMILNYVIRKNRIVGGENE